MTDLQDTGLLPLTIISSILKTVDADTILRDVRTGKLLGVRCEGSWADDCYVADLRTCARYYGITLEGEQ